MNRNDAGFTLMEILLSVAVILILGSLLVVSTNAAFHGASQSSKAANTAVTLARIDRHIRLRTGAVHIPYWADSTLYIDALSAELYRSNIGHYIKSVETIFDRRRAPRGIQVFYTVNNHEMRTLALFPSVVIVDLTQ